METEKPQKKLSSYEKISKQFNDSLRRFFDKLKFKEGEHWSKKVLKVLIRIVSILVLIALSPLILITVLMVMAFAM